MTPEKLKQLIVETMDEVYRMSDKDKFQLKKRGLTGRDDAWLRRQIGLQYDKEVQKDITNLRQYNQINNSTQQGKEMIAAFQNASGVTIAHGLGYISYAESELGGQSDTSRKSLKSWLDRYGDLSKNQLSTVAWIGSPEDLPAKFTSYGNHEAITGGTGFLLKGYPVLVSHSSVSSQTLSSLPKELVDHQTQSGIAKRGSFEQPIYSLDQMRYSKFRPGWAAEVLLDNWTVIGCFVTEELMMEAQKNNTLSSLLDDVDATGLPCQVFSRSGWSGKI
tara:strand:+ start:1603 stop:2430 length:828 start_codon:yes stop_codon:yes gene_type:complete